MPARSLPLGTAYTIGARHWFDGFFSWAFPGLGEHDRLRMLTHGADYRWISLNEVLMQN